MKFHALFLAILLPFGANAGPLAREHVAANAQWLIHLDVDAFLGTQVGSFVGRELLDQQLTKLTKGLKEQFDIEFDWRKIHGVTAYGMDFRRPEKLHGVLLIQSDLEIVEALDTVVARLSGQAGDDAPLKRVQDQPFPVYASKNGVFGAPVAKGLFALARKREHLDQARQVLTGQADSLTSTKTFSGPATQPAGFLTVSIADTAAAGAALPPRARVLKDTQGAQVVAGEKAENVFLRASLKAKDATVAAQVQQALQGVIALALLSELENKDLKQLAESAKVSGQANTVTLEVQLPVNTVTERLTKTQKKRRG